MQNCKKILKENRRTIIKCMNSSDTKTEAENWIKDNARRIISALQTAEKQLGRNKEQETEKLFRLCLSITQNGDIPDEKGLITIFSHENLTSSACGLLPCFLAAGLACAVGNAAESDEYRDEIISQGVKNLLSLPDTDFDAIREAVCRTEQYLLCDPAGVYADMSEETKKQYRKAAAKGAKREGINEDRFVLEALEKARNKENGGEHIGFYLPIKKQNEKAGRIFLYAEILISLLLSILISVISDEPLFFFLSFIPLFSLLKPLSDFIGGRLFPVIPLCSMDEEKSISAENETLIVISSLLPTGNKAEELYSHLSAVRSSDKNGKVRLMLLLDKRSAKTPDLPGDEADTEAVKRLTDRLNRDNDGGFAVAVRERTFSPTENEYTGAERKRGAITALIKYLRGSRGEEFSLIYGDTKDITNVKYIAALDSDTLLSFEVLKKLCAIASHPLNRPVIDKNTGRVISGYGCIVPRIETSIASARKTFFTRLYTCGGSVAYSSAVSERYMDMFGTTLFTGKGLIDVDAYNEVIGSRFETGRILSHDILEGSLLRTAFAGNCEFTDSFPSKPSSFFNRAERWIRGDVQNLKYILRPIATEPVETVLPDLTKYQLADNCRRALSPVFALAGIITALFINSPYAVLLLAVCILSECSDSIFSCLSLILRGSISSVYRLYFSTELTNGAKSFIKLFIDAGFLPQRAAVNTAAISKSLYRMIFSKKNLLQWTTAQQADSRTDRNIGVSVCVPLLTIIICSVFGNSFARLFALCVFISMIFSQTKGIELTQKKAKTPDNKEREILYSFEASMWRFFSENVNKKENHLPPDNIQETPVRKTAHRTSPTNIGLYMVSACAACDLGMISRGELLERMTATLGTISRLKKYKGCLLNWYDTRTLAPLNPEYVSAVDCGNFLCCLTAFRETMKEYARTDERFNALEIYTGRIINDTDLSFLYDKKRDLFRIGSDTDGELSSSFYDLLMSEFRMTSYYETARRQVPSKHWTVPGRTLLRSGRYSAAASWTGTMFEYFMPALFIPVIPQSFQYETLKVALSAQKNRVKKLGIPYGISESCFYSVDASSNYRYKAHGISNLAMKRLADDEPVISPYSTFLTLPFDIKGAMKNLSALSALHAEGSYGFYEAVDFTAKRTDGEDYCIVRCYMSHHIGMSMISVANTLLDGIFIKRFMSDKDMASAESLLCEKIPEDTDIFKRRIKRDNTNRPERINDIRTESSEAPVTEAAAYGNGEWTFFTDIYGRNTSVFSSLEIYRTTGNSRGITLSAKVNDEIFPLNTTADTKGRITKTSFITERKDEAFSITAAFPVHPSFPALLIPIKISNKSKNTLNAEVTAYFEPSLLPLSETDTHPAFTDMFLRPSYSKQNKALCFERLRSAEGTPALCVGMYSSSVFRYEIERERILSRDTDREYPSFFASYTPDETKGVISPVAAVTIPFNLPPGKSEEKVLILTCAGNKTEAMERLSEVRAHRLPDITKAAGMLFAGDPFTANAADTVIKTKFFTCETDTARLKALNTLTGGKSDLWQTGLSGDNVIITVNTAEDCSENALRSFIVLHGRLKKSGIKNDLAFLFRQTEDYSKTGEQTLRRLIKEADMTDEEDRNGGIKLLNTNAFPERVLNTVLAFSSFIYPESGTSPLTIKTSAKIKKGTIPGNARHGFSDGGFYISRHPAIPWCHTLSNKSFGVLLTDRSAGYSWCLNSRQNKLTPWSNNTSADLNGERLFLSDGTDVYDCFGNCEVFFADDRARYISVCGNIKVTVTVTVPERGMKKKISVTAENLSDKTAEIRLIYRIYPVMHEHERYSEFIRCKSTEQGIILTNPVNEDIRGFMLLYGESDAAYNISSESVNRYTQAGYVILVSPKNSITKSFGICFARTPAALRQLKETSDEPRKPMNLTPYVSVKKGRTFASALLLHQVYDTRLLARTGFYQCSGAYGFRDQLQDILPLMKLKPSFCREIILKMCAVQFPEGDVLHWFHPLYKSGRNHYAGVRTKCSDDMLWLPFAVASYIEKTGDNGILDKKLPFLKGELLKENEHDRYEQYVHSDKKATVYEHCLLCFSAAKGTGEHSLPLIKGGDWNDSFGEIGINGRGESVWLAMFLKAAAESFAKVCKLKNDSQNKDKLLKLAQNNAYALDRFAWDGKKYLRAFYDDGTPVGTDGNEECETDILPQAWAVLSDMPDRERRITALDTAYDRLFDEEHGIIKLFSPPFTRNGKRAGYVNDYPGGMRENGGQYTHAAVWFLMALRKEGLDDKADKILHALLPDKKNEEIYRTEPYAMCGDVYSAEGLEGRGGWSLYTGSAGWMAQYFLDF